MGEIHNLDDKRPSSRSLKPPGGGGTFDDMETRFQALEKGFETINGKLDRLIDAVGSSRLDSATKAGEVNTRLASIDAKLDAKASAEAVARLEEASKHFIGPCFLITSTVLILTLFSALWAYAGHVSFQLEKPQQHNEAK
jgi:hypothetical protein